jgi:molybdopterin-guanine dinucleotide biosynthesis protein A
VSCDRPLLRADVVRHLVTLADGQEAVVPSVDGRPVPDCAVYDARVAAGVAAALVAGGERRLRALPARLRTRTVAEAALRALDPSLDSLRDCDTPEAYAWALATAGFTA